MHTDYAGWKDCAVLSRFSRVWLFVTLWVIAHQAPLSMGFSRQEYWSGLPFLPPGDLPHPGIEPKSFTFPTLAGGFFSTSTTWKDCSFPINHDVYNTQNHTEHSLILDESTGISVSFDALPKVYPYKCQSQFYGTPEKKKRSFELSVEANKAEISMRKEGSDLERVD